MIRRITSVYSIFIGMIMIGMWVFYIMAGQVPEFRTDFVAILFHLVAEFLTATLLIIGGLSLFMDKKWGFNINLVALGMLLYTVILSPGYFAQPGGEASLGMFGILIALTVIFITISLLKEDELRI